MNPARFNGVEPRAFLGQENREQSGSFPCAFDFLVMPMNPQARHLALMPGSMIPKHE